MANGFRELAAKFKQRHITKRKACMVLTALALVVTVGTVWALVQPASAMEGNLVCGMEEHIHTEACYERQLCCGQDEGEAHTHTDECWETVLVCPLTEHTHAESCYEKPASESASQPESQPESEPASQPESQPESEPASQPESQPESQPASQPESQPASEPASQPESEPETEPEPEPPLDVQQMPKEIPANYTDLRTAQANGVTVHVYAQPGTIPEGVRLDVQMLDENSAEFAQAVQRLQSAGIEYDFVKTLDVSLRDANGSETEPAAPVYVMMDAGAILPADADPESIQIQHHKEIKQPMPQAAVQGDQPQEEPSAEEVCPPMAEEIVLESVLDAEKGLLTKSADTDSLIATFPVEGFSKFTITFGDKNHPWKTLRADCVDKDGNEVGGSGDAEGTHFNWRKDDKGNVWVAPPQRPNMTIPEIPGYTFAGRVYFEKGFGRKQYISGIRYEGKKWQYYPEGKTATSDLQLFDTSNILHFVYEKEIPCSVVCIDESANILRNDVLYGFDNNSEKEVTEFNRSKALDYPEMQDRFYSGIAYVGTERNKTKVSISALKKVSAGKYEYKTKDGRWHSLKSNENIYLVYKLYPDKRTDTVDTRQKGITINLFNYSPKEINQNHEFQFGSNGGENKINSWTGDASVRQDIVQKNLVNGYPKLDKKYGSESLAYLFDPKQSVPGKENYPDLNKLFWIDKDGYYTYDSMESYATIVSDGQTASGKTDFTVYTKPVLPDVKFTGQNPKFMPLDPIQAISLNKKDGAKRDYYFGMTIEIAFLMPPGGKVPVSTGGYKDMIFDFDGDDDVWVFVDDTLALDLGGIHDSTGGQINFATGAITYDSGSKANDQNLWKLLNPKAENAEQAGFGEYTTHRLKFFYMERGAGASNCKIQFNMPPVLHNLVVGKRLPNDFSQQTGIAPAKNLNYIFKVEYQNPGENHRNPLANAEYELYQWNAQTNKSEYLKKGKTDEKGLFTLKPDQRARFAGKINLENAGMHTEQGKPVHIWVSEVLPEGVKNVDCWDGSPNKPKTYIVKNGQKRVPPLYDGLNPEKERCHNEQNQTQLWNGNNAGRKPEMVEVQMEAYRDVGFNWVDFQNDMGDLAELNITKDARRTDDTPITGEKFNAKIELWDSEKVSASGEKGDWIALPEGSPYWILKPGETSGQVPMQYLGKDADGQIAIEHGQTIHLNLVTGTKYRISEVLSQEQQLIYKVEYEGTVTNLSAPTTEKLTPNQTTGPDSVQTSIGNQAPVQAHSIHQVTIHNTGDPVIPAHLNITKQVKGTPAPNAEFKIKVETTTDGGKSWKSLPEGTPYTLAPDNQNGTVPKDGLITIKADQTIGLTLPEGTQYRVSELDPGEDYTVMYTGTIQGGEIIQPDADGQHIGSTLAGGAVHDIVVANTNHSIDLSGAQFALTKKVVDMTGTEITPDETFEFTIKLEGYTQYGNSEKQVTAEYVAESGIKRLEHITFRGTKKDAYWPIYTNFEAAVALKPGETILLKDLPQDVTAIVVTEQNLAAKYDVPDMQEKNTDNKVHGNTLTTIHAPSLNNPPHVICTNKDKTPLPSLSGDLTIHKTVVDNASPDGKPLDLNRLFEFKVSISDLTKEDAAKGYVLMYAPAAQTTDQPNVVRFEKEPLSEEYTAIVKAKHDQSVTIQGLPAGVVVTVAEINHEGYAADLDPDNPGTQQSVSVTIEGGQTIDVNCTNITGVEMPETGGRGRMPVYLVGGSLILCAVVWLLRRRREEAAKQ